MKDLKQLWKHCVNIKTGILLISLWVPMTGALAQPLSLQEAVDMALKNGTDIKIAAQEAEKARLGVVGARGGKEPSISLRSGVTFQDAANKDSSTNNSNSLQLSLPVYTGGKLEATLEKAQQTLDASVLQVKRTRQNTKLKVASAYYQVLQAKSMMAVNEETVKNNREHVKNVRALYGAGRYCQIRCTAFGRRTGQCRTGFAETAKRLCPGCQQPEKHHQGENPERP